MAVTSNARAGQFPALALVTDVGEVTLPPGMGEALWKESQLTKQRRKLRSAKGAAAQAAKQELNEALAEVRETLELYTAEIEIIFEVRTLDNTEHTIVAKGELVATVDSLKPDDLVMMTGEVKDDVSTVETIEVYTKAGGGENDSKSEPENGATNSEDLDEEDEDLDESEGAAEGDDPAEGGAEE
jgi:hypothetical protein